MASAEYKRDKMREKRGYKGRSWVRRGETPAQRQRRSVLKHRYGLTPEDYAQLLLEQHGVCAVCGRPPGEKSLAVDHDHITGKVRGLLCELCNTAIGKLGDTIAGLEAALEYLKKGR